MLGTSLNKDNTFSKTKSKGNRSSKKKTMSPTPLTKSTKTAANAIYATTYS